MCVVYQVSQMTQGPAEKFSRNRIFRRKNIDILHGMQLRKEEDQNHGEADLGISEESKGGRDRGLWALAGRPQKED